MESDPILVNARSHLQIKVNIQIIIIESSSAVAVSLYKRLAIWASNSSSQHVSILPGKVKKVLLASDLIRDSPI